MTGDAAEPECVLVVDLAAKGAAAPRVMLRGRDTRQPVGRRQIPGGGHAERTEQRALEERIQALAAHRLDGLAK